MASEWEEQVRAAREVFARSKTKENIVSTWRIHANLGHKTLGRILTYSDEAFEKMIAKREN